MTTLETHFIEVVDSLDLPDRDLVSAVLARIDGDPQVSRGRVRVVLVAAAIILAGVLAVAPARDAVANWFGIGATTVEVRPGPDERIDGATSSADALGVAVNGPVAVDVLVSLGPPTGIFDDGVRGRSFTWAADADLPAIDNSGLGAILSVRRTNADPSLKSVAADVGVEFVEIPLADGPVAGLWIRGEHQLFIGGTVGPYLAQRVLLWVVDGIEYRLEINAGLDTALDLAVSAKRGTELLAAE